jgi:hypothetical protein
MYVGAGEDMVRYVCGGRRRHGEVCMWGREDEWKAGKKMAEGGAAIVFDRAHTRTNLS